MAQEDVRLSGTQLDSTGAAVEGLTVTLFAEGTTSPALATDTTDSSGEWDFTRTTPGRYDVQIVDGSETFRILARDKFQVTELTTRNPTTALPALSAYSTTSEASSLVATFGFRPSTESSGVETPDTPSDNDEGYINFTLSNDNATPQQWDAARITWIGTDVSDGTEDADLEFETMVNGALATALKIGVSGATGSIIKDEDNMVSDSAVHLATQQSIKAYVDTEISSAIGSNNEWSEILANGNTSGANDVIIDNGQGLVVGHTAQVATGGVTAEFQVLGTGASDGDALLYKSSTTDTAAPTLNFAKSASGTIGTETTAVADNETLGIIYWRGSDTGDVASQAASIAAYVDGTAGSNDLPGRLVLATTADGANSPTEALRIDSNQNTLIADGNGIVVGHTTQLATNVGTSEFQIIGTGGPDGSAMIGRFSANGGGASIDFLKSRATSIGGASGMPNDNDAVAVIRGVVDDEVDYTTPIGDLTLEVDDGSPAANAVGGAWRFRTTTTAGSLTEALRIDSSQNLSMRTESEFFIGPAAASGNFTNGNMAVGLTINQGANDDQILAFKSSDVAHGITGEAETDTYAAFGKFQATSGGLLVHGFKDADGTAGYAVVIRGDLGETADTSDDVNSVGVIQMMARKKSGTSVTTLGDTENILMVGNADSARVLVKGNGDFHVTNTTLVALDGEDDIALIRAYQRESSNDIGIAMSKWDEGLQANRSDLIRTGVWSSGGDFTIQQRMNDLLGGGIWQLNTKHMSLVEEVQSLRSDLAIAQKQLKALSN